MSGANHSQRKRKHKRKAPPGPDQAVIGWKEEEFHNLVQGMGFRPEWGAQYPTAGSTALDAPPSYLSLYAAFFREGNFRLPITKFTASVLRNYGLHISQINAIGLPLKSLHDWKQKFFYIRRGVIPTDMHYRSLEEMALVGAGMSLLWVPKNPLGVPVYSYQGKFGYSLINVLDPKAAGAMVEAIQEDGTPTWLSQIRGRFLHPSDESFSKYANVALGEDDEDDPVNPIREEVVVLSSGSSDKSPEGLTSHCARAGTAQGGVDEPIQEVVGDDAEMPVDPSAQLERRKEAKTDKSERGEKRQEGKTAGTSRKRPSTLPCLDYVVVSDTLSGLGVGVKARESDPDDQSTLTDMMRKNAHEDKKRKLDEQAAALLASKKAKLHKEAPPAPSESEIDMGVFSGGRGNLLEEIFAASAPPEIKSGKKPRKLDISQITPPASPPSRTIGLTPPRDDPEKKKKKEDEAAVEDVGEGGGDVAGGAGASGGDRGKGIETEVESSEATPCQTIYTKCPSSGGGATSGAVRSP
ncbi:hypothetical protein HanIR_Chr13g0658341 [Helianthus annuus]|nr:hypothetical protein HanIR_Chr13g0658341 [Helianthus annuus]